jgi:hypothetical protein
VNGNPIEYVSRDHCDENCGRMLGEVGQSHQKVDEMGERVARLDTLVRESVVERLEELTSEFRQGLAAVRLSVDALAVRLGTLEAMGPARELAAATRKLSVIEKVGVGFLLAGGGAAIEFFVRRLLGG